jgi:hypothetical protein
VLELFDEERVDGSRVLALGVLGLGRLQPLLVHNDSIFFRKLSSLLAGKLKGVASLVPLAEWGSINGDDSSLDQSLGSDQLVVCGVVNGVCDTGLASGLFRGP